VLAPCAIGDLLDRITILAIKRVRIDAARRPAVEAELGALEATWSAAGLPDLPQRAELAAINLELWEVEDALRTCEALQDFGADFVALARRVYHLNDRRAAVKRTVNLALGSDYVEQKVLPDYAGRP
jgi:hypothetical protein